MKPSLPPCAHPQGLPCCPPPLWPAQAKQCTVCTMGPANNEDDSKRGQLCFTRPGKTDKVNKVTKPLLLPGNHMQARSGETEGLTLVCYYNQSICYPVISAEERFVFQDTVLQSVEWIRRWAPHFKAAVDKEEYWVSKDLKRMTHFATNVPFMYMTMLSLWKAQYYKMLFALHLHCTAILNS